MSNPHPNVFGVMRRGSFGFHQRDLNRATVGRRQSYGTPRNLPVLLIRTSVRRSVRRFIEDSTDSRRYVRLGESPLA